MRDATKTTILLVAFAVATVGCVGAIDTGEPSSSGGAGRAAQVGASSSRSAGHGAGGAGGSTAAGCMDESIPARVWRLGPRQLENSVAKSLGVSGFDLSSAPGDLVDPSTGFVNGAEGNYVSSQLAELLVSQTELAAAKFGDQLGTAFPCMVAATVPDACVSDFATKLGRKLLRRPLSDEEKAAYTKLFKDNQQSQTSKIAAQMVVQALLLSPSFLYRTELGNGSADRRLTSYEIASAISYGLADSPPDDDLLAAADANKLGDPAVREQFARGLLNGQPAKEKFSDFVYWQVLLNRVDERKAEIGSDLVGSLVGETRAFAQDVFGGATPTLTSLYTAHYGFVNSSLAPVYGVTSSSKTLSRVELPADQRFGLFTQAGWLTGTLGPIHRGRTVRNTFLCEAIAPPAGIDPKELTKQLPVTPPEATEREKWDAFVSANPGCTSCHKMFQPLGLALDVYDANGKYRTKNEAGRTIDPGNQISNPNGWSGKFSGPGDLINQIAASSTGQACFAQRYLTYFYGRAIGSGEESCLTRDVAAKFVDRKLDLRELMVAAVTSDAFLRRTAP